MIRELILSIAEKIMIILKAVWDFCRFLFWPRWGRKALMILFLVPICLKAQEYDSMTGLLHTPSAEMDSAGTFRGGITFLHRDFLPATMPKKNTYNYYIGITPWRWLEMSYCASLLWMNRNWNVNEPMGYYNEDRRVNVKVHPLYEGEWWPGVAIGFDDVGRFDKYKSGDYRGNNFYQNVYFAATKHFDLKGYELGTHLVYRYYASDANSDRRGIAGGITLRPAFYKPLRVIVEWDGVGINAGADVLLWRHMFVQAALVNGRGFMGGVSYHYKIKY